MIITKDHISIIQKIAIGIVPKQDVDDLVQDTLLNLISYNPEIKGDVKKYLAVCVYQSFYKRRQSLRYQKRNAKTCSIDDILIEPKTLPNQIHHVELLETIDTFFKLPNKWALSISLSFDGLTVSEIAKEIGCTRNSVMIWLSNGRRVLSNPDLLGTRISARGNITSRICLQYY